MQKTISIRGARQHNLKNISVEIPRDELTVITGLSGSGKSSLAFDTLYAEGQRRYVESLSAYARQFLELMEKPDVDSIEGLSPAISIEQKTTSKNPRSTVGTVTELYDYLRLLFARIGVPHSPATGLPIVAQTVSQIVDRVMQLPEKTKFLLLAPIVQGRKGEYKKELLELKKKGFQRVKVNKELYDIDDVPALNKNMKHNIDVVVDRLVVGPGLETRLSDSLETTLNLANGIAVVEDATTGEHHIFSTKFMCPVSGFSLTEIEPRLFSFNSPFGACPSCDGLGVQIQFDPNLVVPDANLSLETGAIAPWNESATGPKKRFQINDYYSQVLEGVARHYRFSMKTPFNQLSKEQQEVILYGSGKQSIDREYLTTNITLKSSKPFEGVIPNLNRRWRETDSNWVRSELEKYQTSQPCPTCEGHRLKPEALCVKIDNNHIGQITNLSIKKAYEWFCNLNLSDKDRDIANRILKEITSRLKFLIDVGLDYLTLARESGTLSGGESQRIRLASQIGSGLTGVLYVLDEPSIGLHQRDNDRLLGTLKHLRDIGNTVVVVEHDEDAIKCADYVIDMGPGAGAHGGQIISQGTPAQVMDDPSSITGQYLKGTKEIEIPVSTRPASADQPRAIKLIGAKANNLKNVTVSFPLGTLTCITGVSGGGKSSLIIETLYKALARKVMGSSILPGAHDAVLGTEYIDKVIDIDQSPIGRTPRSNPATYIGCFTPIREWFANLPEAKARGYSAGRFSFNVKGGRCEACQGDGVIKIEMHFLPDVYVTCDQCKGKRFNRETLDIHFKGKTIAQILDMTVDEAVGFFEAIPSVRDKLAVLQKVGLGYIHLGQQATTLSGGEAQRIKLAKELSKRATGQTLYILDEPTTGLHFEDIKKLLEVLQALVNQGNTVIVIEHNLDVIKTADWVIDMGPEGGDGGGKLVACGTPQQVSQIKHSPTGQYLKRYFGPDHQLTEKGSPNTKSANSDKDLKKSKKVNQN